MTYIFLVSAVPSTLFYFIRNSMEVSPFEEATAAELVQKFSGFCHPEA
jgi:hypothetical protein